MHIHANKTSFNKSFVQYNENVVKGKTFLHCFFFFPRAVHFIILQYFLAPFITSVLWKFMFPSSSLVMARELINVRKA